MNIYVYPTDHSWFDFLRRRPDLDEVNFWQPGGGHVFSRLNPGDLFLFRLKHPINMIAGGGIFVHSSIYPVDLAWQAFGEKNGTNTLGELRRLIARYKRLPTPEHLPGDARIGCIILQSPFFWDRDQWLQVPVDYSLNLVQGKRYDAEQGTGQLLRDAALRLIEARHRPAVTELPQVQEVYGQPALVRRRLGQGAFRVLVTDNYARHCAVSGEHTLPVLQAAHILPISRGGKHRPDNGLLLRSDIHTLFDLGYVTVDPDYRFRVSAALREQYANGRVYYDMRDKSISLPAATADHPSREFLEWHRDHVFRS